MYKPITNNMTNNILPSSFMNDLLIDTLIEIYSRIAKRFPDIIALFMDLGKIMNPTNNDPGSSSGDPVLPGGVNSGVGNPGGDKPGGSTPSW